MRILGDLNGNEAHRTNDLSESRAPAGEGPAMKDRQVVGPENRWVPEHRNPRKTSAMHSQVGFRKPTPLRTCAAAGNLATVPAT